MRNIYLLAFLFTWLGAAAQDPTHKLMPAADTAGIRPFLLGEVEYDSKRNSTSYGATAGAFSVLNTVASYHVWKYISIEGGINNLFDRNYSLVEGYPEPGRNYFVNVRYRY